MNFGIELKGQKYYCLPEDSKIWKENGYRFSLELIANEHPTSTLLVVGINPGGKTNPSTGVFGKTVRKVLGLPYNGQYDSFLFVNLTPVIAGEPDELKTKSSSIRSMHGENIKAIESLIEGHSIKGVLLCYGNNIKYVREHSAEVLETIKDRLGDDKFFCLGITGKGFPRHPAYIMSDTKLKKCLVNTENGTVALTESEDISKEEKFRQVLGQARSLVAGETEAIANMANIAALLHRTFGFWWTGFYRVCGEELVLGPFQGPIACTRIPFGKGVCGSAWQREETIVVPDVEKFPGHIACSSESRSEIVVPVWKDGKIAAVLDIDSDKLGTFDNTDRKYLEEICHMIG